MEKQVIADSLIDSFIRYIAHSVSFVNVIDSLLHVID